MEMMLPMWALCILAIMSINLCDASKGAKMHHQVDHHQHNLHRCLSEQEEVTPEIVRKFTGRNVSWNNYIAVKLVPHLENVEAKNKRRRKRSQEKECPVQEFQQSGHDDQYAKRSLSPWSYHIDYDENRYPQKLAFARCLCTGCIDAHSIKETFSLNSVAIHQTMMVLRRKPCPNNESSYTFKLDYIKVPVGCTCVRPRRSFQQ
ncbi:interleukin-17C [Spea bombifrons]|uniref:interleukin-17C n=1 Tax=Spea bombifrons TaxID=233779 RepID=UPI00234B84F4|nr:interleukin-17C [Spea bombifrons]